MLLLMTIFTTDDDIKSLYVSFTKRLREDVGAKFQTVIYNKWCLTISLHKDTLPALSFGISPRYLVLNITAISLAI